MTRSGTTALLAAALATFAGCGGSKPSSSSSSSGGANALSAEAKSAATGDIPDNQNFLTFKGAGFSMCYPEGWAQTGSGGNVSFRDKNNIVHVVVARGAQPTATSVAAEIAKQKARTHSLKAGVPRAVALPAGKSV